ncbi:MAG: non-heme iron oxygenase ferredoxin subunit [Actinomycetales bacterium]
MSPFRPACRLMELQPDSPVRCVIDGQAYALVLTDGETFAIYDECSHAQVPLSEGEVADCAIECWLHGSAFDLRTGSPRSLPAITPVPVFPTRIVGEGSDAVVEIDLPSPDYSRQEGAA